MSLAKRQLVALTEEALKEFYQAGYIPTIEEVAVRINEKIGDKTLGMPNVKYRPALSRRKSNPEDWNRTVDEIYTDLLLLYEESLAQINKILIDFDFCEVERRKVERQAAQLEDRIKELLLLNNNVDGYLYSVFDDLKTLEKIDLSNTSAWLDLGLSEVCLPYAKTGNTKLTTLPPEGKLLNDEGVISSTDLSGSTLEHIVDDSLNTCWNHKVITETPGFEVKYQLTFKLDGEPCTRIAINPHVTGMVKIEARYSEDGETFRSLGASYNQELIAYDFSEMRLKGLQIIISKTTHDEMVSLGNKNGYVYYFGLKNVSFYKIGFEQTATLQSTALAVTDRQSRPVIFDRLSLEVDEVVPDGCGINYYLALKTKLDENNPSWIPDWQPITPIYRDSAEAPKSIDLKSISSYHPSAVMVPSSNVYGGEPINGLKFYTMGSIPLGRNLMVESFEMYKGIKQFKRDKYKAYFDATGPLWSERKEPQISDWIEIPNCPLPDIKDKPVVSSNYLNISSSLSFSSQDRYCVFRFATSAYFKQAVSSFNSVIRTTTAGSKINLVIFINGKKIDLQKSKESTYVVDNTGVEGQFSFNQGWNSVLILAYKDDDLSTSLTLGSFANTLMSLEEKNIRAEMDSMIFVPLFDYLYNVYEKETDKYSISEDNKIVIGEFQKKQNARYVFSYRYRIDQGYTNKIYFKAELQRGEDSAVSPKLKYYKIRVI